MIINVSAVELYLTCRRKWYYRYVKGYADEHSEAMQQGTDWHAVCAGTRPILPSDPAWLSGAAAEWARESATWGLSVVGREIPLAAPLGSHTLVGRLDALAIWNGKLWHVQHKSARASLPLARYFTLIKRSWHEAAYAYLVGQNAPRITQMLQDPRFDEWKPLGYSLSSKMAPGAPPESWYGGSILVCARKLTDQSRRPVAQRTPYLVIEPLPLRDIPGVMGELQDYTDEMQLLVDQDDSMSPQNRTACMGGFGNHPCEYLPLCEGLTQGREITYAIVDPLGSYPVEFQEALKCGK